MTLLAKYDRRVPRYTSYPTAPQFLPGVQAAAYRDAVVAGARPTVRGLALDTDDRLRGAVIVRLMCDLEVDLGAVCAAFACALEIFSDELAALAPMRADRLVRLKGPRIAVTPEGRPFLRAVCAVFDRHLKPEETRHVQAV